MQWLTIWPHTRSAQPWKLYLLDNVATDLFLEIQLMSLALATGINDSTTYPDYRTFASNQTGNTAFLAVGALHIAADNVKLQFAGFSLGMFILGGYCMGQLGDRFGPRRRWWLLVTNTLQSLMVFAAAALRQWVATESQDLSSWSVISLLAFAAGAQVAMARTVNVPEVTTAMVTSAYIDVMVDPDIFHIRNRARNRRIFFVLSLLAGGFIGAAAYRYVGPAFGLLLSGICKAAVCLSFLFNRAIPKMDQHGEEGLEGSNVLRVGPGGSWRLSSSSVDSKRPAAADVME